MVVTRRGRPPRKAFHAMFGFDPVQGEGSLRKMERGLERAIVAQELLTIWRSIGRCEMELQQRDPPAWMKKHAHGSVPDRLKLQRHLDRFKLRYANAERLARAFNLHPEQPAQS